MKSEHGMCTLHKQHNVHATTRCCNKSCSSHFMASLYYCHHCYPSIEFHVCTFIMLKVQALLDTNCWDPSRINLCRASNAFSLVFKSSMPFKCDLALQSIPLSKQPFKLQPQIENEDVTWSPQYNMPATRTNKRRALSLQEIEFDGWFLILHIVLETCTI